MKTTIDLSSPDLASLVLERLSSITDIPIPAKGCLSGGSVANTILNLIDGTNTYPVNDLDIFEVFVSEFPTVKDNQMPFRANSYEISPDVQYEHINILTKGGYRVLRSYRRGMLNFVKIRPYQDWSKDLLVNMILDGFDLNCCQAGIDLETGKLYMTPYFEEFVRTRQLRVTTVFTPLHTIIRLPKKQAELSCYLDLEHEVSMLATYVDLEYHGTYMSPEYRLDPFRPAKHSLFFGKRYHAMFKKYAEIIAPYAELEQLKSLPLSYKGIIRKGDLLEEECWDNAMYRMQAGVDQNGKCTGGVMCNPDLWTLNLKGSRYDEFMENKTFPNYSYADSKAFITAWDMSLRKTTRRVERERYKRATTGYTVLSHLCLYNPSLCECDFKDKHYSRVQKFHSTHTVGMRLGRTILDQYKSIQTLESLENKYGFLPIGLLERELLDSKEIPSPITSEWVDQAVEEYIQMNGAQLCQPVPMFLFPLKAFVKELTTTAELISEGSKQRHCVGGFASAIKSGTCRIFSIEIAGAISTIEIGYGRQNPWLADGVVRINQHRGYRNSDVSKIEARIGKALCLYLKLYEAFICGNFRAVVRSEVEDLKYIIRGLVNGGLKRKVSRSRFLIQKTVRSWFAPKAVQAENIEPDWSDCPF